MVLINNLTIDEINAALLHLQRSRSEVVGGEKGNTVNNVTVNSSGNGGGYSVDYSSLIKQITDRLSNVETKTNENESNINQQANVNANQQSLIEEIEETLNNLTQSGITQLYFDEQTRTLTIYTTEGQYNTEIPSEEVTMSLANNVLTFTMGGQTVTVNMPYIPASEKGAAGGVATLDSSGRLPYSQLPAGQVSSVNNLSGDVVLNGTNVNYDGTNNSPTLKSKIDSVDTKASTQVDWNEGNTSSLAYIKNKPTIPAAQIQSDWTQTDSTKKDFIKNKIPIWISTTAAQDNMSPIDSVIAGNTRPVTSGGVYSSLEGISGMIGVYSVTMKDLNECYVGQEKPYLSTWLVLQSGGAIPNAPAGVSNYFVICFQLVYSHNLRITQIAFENTGGNLNVGGVYKRQGYGTLGNIAFGDWVAV